MVCDGMSEKCIVVVSGTPGTGKSTFAKKLVEEMDCRLIDLNEVIAGEGIYELDPNGTREVDPEELREVFTEIIEKAEEDLVIEGLLSHFIPPELVSHCVILRTHPDELEIRLKERGYSGKKLKDNMSAEALDVVLGEAVQELGNEKIYEIDTTEITPSEAVGLFMDAMKGRISLEPGSVDWLEDYLEKE